MAVWQSTSDKRFACRVSTSGIKYEIPGEGLKNFSENVADAATRLTSKADADIRYASTPLQVLSLAYGWLLPPTHQIKSIRVAGEELLSATEHL